MSMLSYEFFLRHFKNGEVKQVLCKNQQQIPRKGELIEFEEELYEVEEVYYRIPLKHINPTIFIYIKKSSKFKIS